MASQAASQTQVQSTHPFTCNTCQVAFRSSELQRAHMQTDWHRYNLKRRVASLPPLSSEIFTEKVLANKASAAATAAKASFEKVCTPCQKTYYSENAYNNHLNSQKHKSNVARVSRAHMDDSASMTGSMLSSAFSLGEPMADSGANGIDREAEKEFEEVVEGIKQTSIEEDPLSRRPTRPHHSAAEDRPEHPLSRTATTSTGTRDDDTSSVATSTRPPADPLLDCLFCNYRSPSLSLNIHHMGRFHGMFIPEKEYLEEPEGLIQHLHERVHKDHRCLKCNKQLHTASGIQTHMRDRGHCMIAFESDEELVEVGQFYDFRSTYSDADDFEDAEREAEADSDDSESTAGGGVKLGAPRKTVISTEDTAMSGDEEDEGWETDSTVSSVPTDEITAVPIDDRSHRYKLLSNSRHHTHGDPRPHRSVDGFHSHAHATPVAVYHDDYELHLPSGRTAGHRSLNKYYRQNLRNYPGVAERMESRRTITGPTSDSDGDVDMDREEGEDRTNSGRGRQVISRANGGLGMVGVSDHKKAEIRAVEKRERKREQRARTKYQAGNERRSNFQKHFRDPLLQ
ncbi:C2H2 type zinc-finger-domain-containing protein [Lophiotrema nucula]|uniref:C2H2 type zinc-finger-domain-containing protein n=1 Tax=Lophiotrema nucula TaxID=690887 RepID=A0A6A5Z9J8_9PLEO|nr:C2H2 type zinc-finger-domain-containing protein [Lophiotrema nucula]